MQMFYGENTTVNGYRSDEAISALQKFIRRGETERAVRAAYELARTSPGMKEYLWRRLLIISVEDIGLGEPMAPVQIYCLNETRKEYETEPGEFGMFFVHAVRYLCTCKKERGSCNLSLLEKARMEAGEAPLDFPDYVYDRHTQRGVDMGRGQKHFLEEAGVVIPEVARDGGPQWKAQLAALTENEPEPYRKVIYSGQKTVHGYPFDVCVSALQKFIRRGETERAVRAAFELALCGPFWLEFVWKRLRLISVEDVCLGNPNAQVLVHTLDRIRREVYTEGGLHPMYFTHAIRCLCLSPKERGSCLLEHVMERRMARGEVELTFPDYVYDKHTGKGAAMGRGEEHFLTEAAKVRPEAEIDGNHWAEELLAWSKERGTH